MALGALGRVLPATLDEVNDFLAFDLVDDFGLNASVFDHGRADLRVVTAQHQHFVELNSLTSGGRNTFHAQHIARLYFILLTACFQDRKHRSSFASSASVGPRLRAFRIRVASAST